MHQALVFTFDEKNLSAHPNADNLLIYDINGAQVIVNKNLYHTGDVCLYFLPDTQIESWFLTQNRLYRKNPTNPAEKWPGFFEENGRVRIVKLRGVYSQGFIFNLRDEYGLKEGDLVDELEGQHLCHKYETQAEKVFKEQRIQNEKKLNLFTRTALRIRRWLIPNIKPVTLKEHIDTPQLVHAIFNYVVGDLITITKKYHGTSGRTAKLTFNTNVSIFDKRYWIDKKFTGFYKTIQVSTEQTGTRRTLVYDSLRGIGVNDMNYRIAIHHQLAPLLKEGQTIYYEIVGYEPSGKTIMPNHGEYKYTYGCVPGGCQFLIYRMTETNPYTGIVREFTYDEVVNFCLLNNLIWVDAVTQFTYDGNPKTISDFVIRYCEQNPYHYDGLLEGLVVRNDNESRCVFAKYKSNLFSEAEGIALQSEKFIDPETVS